MTDAWDARLGLIRLLDALEDPELDLAAEPELREVETVLVQAQRRIREVTPERDLRLLALS